tara:strand:+ start:193 stop:1500 length:1308 start_codon:yes stop_codon:yes gene_type:complete
MALSDIFRKKPKMTDTYGDAGVPIYSGFVDNDFLKELNGTRGRKIYRQMSENSPIISGFLNVSKTLIEGAGFDFRSVDENTDSVALEDRVKEDYSNLRRPLYQCILDAIDEAFVYGFSLQEATYERADNRIKPKSIDIRSATTLERWITADDGVTPIGIVQDLVNGGQVEIPMTKMIHHTAMDWRGSPEGKSLLRGCYPTWYRLNKHEEHRDIALAKDIRNATVIRVPQELIRWANTPINASMDDETKARINAAINALEVYKKAARDPNFNSQTGFVLPSDTFVTNAGTQEEKVSNVRKYEIELLKAENSDHKDLMETIKEKQDELRQNLLIAFIALGSNRGGSQALAKELTEMLALSLEGQMRRYADSFNNQELRRYAVLNNLDYDALPKLTPNRIKTPDLEMLGGFIRDVSGSEIMLDEELGEDVRGLIKGSI